MSSSYPISTILVLLISSTSLCLPIVEASNLRHQQQQPRRNLQLQRQRYPWKKPEKLILTSSNSNNENVSSTSDNDSVNSDHNNNKMKPVIETLPPIDLLDNSNSINSSWLPPGDANIVGGSNAEEPYPYYGLWDVGCGASLIAPDIMLTAAHCSAGYDPIAGRRVYLGSTQLRQGLERRVLQVIPHPKYSTVAAQYDFMLLKLNASAVTQSALDRWNIATIPLNRNNANPQKDNVLQLMGFGTIYEGGSELAEILQEVQVKAYDADCKNSYGSQYDSSLMLCAGFPEGGVDSCQGKVLLVDLFSTVLLHSAVASTSSAFSFVMKLHSPSRFRFIILIMQ